MNSLCLLFSYLRLLLLKILLDQIIILHHDQKGRWPSRPFQLSRYPEQDLPDAGKLKLTSDPDVRTPALCPFPCRQSQGQTGLLFLWLCFTSTETVWFIRDGVLLWSYWSAFSSALEHSLPAHSCCMRFSEGVTVALYYAFLNIYRRGVFI